MDSEEEYSVSDSEDDYSKDDKMLLEYGRKSMRKKENLSDDEVYGFERSESDEDDSDEDENDSEKSDDIDMGSDIVEEENLPDDRAWGKKKRNFYSTDFVDQDYEGVYQGTEAEIAELEEQEAKTIQKRLTEQLNDADFSITEIVNLAKTIEHVPAKQESIETDLSLLTKRQKLDLVKKESPEFFVFVQDFKEKVNEAKKYLFLKNHLKHKMKKQSHPALEYFQTKLSIILNYCTNLSFYFYLKSKRIPIKNHPILKSLFRYRQLLLQMADVDKKIMQPQLEHLIKIIESGKEIPLNEEVFAEKKKLKLLSDKQKKGFQKELAENEAGRDPDDNNDDRNQPEKESKEAEEMVGDIGDDSNEKRAITYEMAKNKGLTPRRKKELRNPRVKNRRKYEKAKIRRRGQVRIPRKEIPVYGGEASGIKVGLTKSIKIK